MLLLKKTVRLTALQHRKLALIAGCNGESSSSAVRKLIDFYFDQTMRYAPQNGGFIRKLREYGF